MKQRAYSSFSLERHLSAAGPRAAQFELTYACPQKCVYCQTAGCAAPALSGKDAMRVLDTLAREKIIWLCLTGGDPLAHPDFRAIYARAKELGFITTVFTNAVLVNKDTADFFRRLPPFCVEVTLNACCERINKKITGTAGAFEKAVRGIKLLQSAGVKVKVKTMVGRFNYGGREKIARFIAREFGLPFTPLADINPTLCGSASPLKYRLPPEEFAAMCYDGQERAACEKTAFTCAAMGQETVFINPSGEVRFCGLWKGESFNILTTPLAGGLAQIKRAALKTLPVKIKCADCKLRAYCGWCPARAALETATIKPVDYYCAAAKKLYAFYKNGGKI